MMERRYEAYKTHVVKPFFREHFARIDRQIVLVDALTAINRGPEAVAIWRKRWRKCWPVFARGSIPSSPPSSRGESTRC